MTLQTMLETIRQTFPGMQEAQVKGDLNAAYQLFSEETRLPFENMDVIHDGSDLSTLDDGGAPDATLYRGNGWYALPAIVRDIVKVEAFDAHDNLVDKPEYCIAYLGNQFNITDIMHDSLVLGGRLPSGIARLRFKVTLIPSALTQDTHSPDLPEQFHQALVDHVLAKYFALKGILQQSGWFRSSYQALVVAGKRYFNRNL